MSRCHLITEMPYRSTLLLKHSTNILRSSRLESLRNSNKQISKNLQNCKLLLRDFLSVPVPPKTNFWICPNTTYRQTNFDEYDAVKCRSSPEGKVRVRAPFFSRSVIRFVATKKYCPGSKSRGISA